MPKEGCHGEDEWVDSHITDRCPVMYYPEYATVFTAYKAYSDGYLPCSGGYFDQPANLMDCIAIVKSEYNKIELELSGGTR